MTPLALALLLLVTAEDLRSEAPSDPWARENALEARQAQLDAQTDSDLRALDGLFTPHAASLLEDQRSAGGREAPDAAGELVDDPAFVGQQPVRPGQQAADVVASAPGAEMIFSGKDLQEAPAPPAAATVVVHTPLVSATSGQRKTRVRTSWLRGELTDCPPAADPEVQCGYEPEKYQLYVLPKDQGVGAAVLYHGYFEPTIVPQMIKDFLGNDPHHPGPGVYVDVGANVGDTTLPLAGILGGGRVVAVEPRRDLAALLKANLEANSQTGAKIYQYGLADAERAVGFDDEQANPAGSHIALKGQGPGDETVALTTLDRLYAEEPLLQHVRVMKIDVEGFEGQVILGGTKFLSERGPCYLYIEFTPAWMKDWAHTPFAKVLPVLQEHYNIYDRTVAGGSEILDAKAMPDGGLQLVLQDGERFATDGARFVQAGAKPGAPKQFNWRLVRKDIGTCLANLRSISGYPGKPKRLVGETERKRREALYRRGPEDNALAEAVKAEGEMRRAAGDSARAWRSRELRAHSPSPLVQHADTRDKIRDAIRDLQGVLGDRPPF